MVKNRRLFTAGKRLRALRELMGLSRPQFAELVGMTAKRLENIENELQHMHEREALLAAEQAPEAEPAPLEEPPEPRRQRKRKTPASGKGD